MKNKILVSIIVIAFSMIIYIGFCRASIQNDTELNYVQSHQTQDLARLDLIRKHIDADNSAMQSLLPEEDDLVNATLSAQNEIDAYINSQTPSENLDVQGTLPPIGS